MSIKNFKIKAKHVMIFLGAASFLFMAKMCETEEYDRQLIVQEINDLQETKDSTLNLADELLEQYYSDSEYREEQMDSLSEVLDNNQQLSEEEIRRLKWLIQKRLEELSVVPDTVVNQVVIDTTIYNEIYQDTIIYDTIIEPIIIIDTVYQIDTLIYDKEDVKVKKKKKN